MHLSSSPGHEKPRHPPLEPVWEWTWWADAESNAASAIGLLAHPPPLSHPLSHSGMERPERRNADPIFPWGLFGSRGNGEGVPFTPSIPRV